MTICAVYARVSDESQVKGDSIQHQISYCREHARRRSTEDGVSWISPESFIYIDEGITGTSMIKRPAVQRLVRDAKVGKFQVVLFKGISRFARDTVDALLMLRTLTACGVRVVSMEENFDSQRDNAEFVFTIHSALAQAESEKTAIRVRVGASEKAKSGKWNGVPADGYLLNPDTKHLQIDDAFAPVIRDIFSMYLSGLGSRRIADALNGQRRFTKRGNLWTQRNISRLLRNPVYVGDVVYGRREKRLAFPDENDPLVRRKRVVWVNNTDQLVVCRNAHPGIVERELFERVQDLMDTRRSMPGQVGMAHLLTKGLLICTCGGNMTVTYNGSGVPYYRCLRQRESGKAACKAGYVRAELIERTVMDRVREDVSRALRFNDITLPARVQNDFARQIDEVQKNIDKQIERSHVLFEQYDDGQWLDEQYQKMSQRIRNRIQSLQKTRDALIRKRDVESVEVDAEQLVRQAMKDFLTLDTMNAQLTKEILSIFVEHVSFVSNQEIEITYRFHHE
jgi:site-specific DNA recombinase